MIDSSQEVIVAPDKLRRFVSDVYQKVGVSKDDADVIANLQVETDLRGVYSHGTRALRRYVNGMKSGFINVRPNMKITKEGLAFALIDGDMGSGYLAGVKGMNLAIAKAKTSGVAMVGVFNSEHYGSASCYSTMALGYGMIGFSTTNTGKASITAPGGIEPVIANNPISYAIPAKEEPPIVLDMACGIAAWGRIVTMSLYGQPIPDGWLLTENGEPTNDASKGKMMIPAAGPKGYGLGIVAGTLAGPLVGGISACMKKNGEPSEHFFFAINIESFTPLDEFTAKIDETIRKIRSSKTADGVDRIYLPGEIEWHNQQKFLKEGLPIHKEHFQDLIKLGEELGIESSKCFLM